MAKRPKHDFHDYMKNPDLVREEAREMHEAETAPPPMADELSEIVAHIRRRPLTYEEEQKLKKAGERAAALLQEALGDKKFISLHYGENVYQGSPLETALDFLEPFRLPHARVLEPALRHAKEHVRYHALYHLARCGNDDAIDALKEGLRSPSEDCRDYTLMGLGFLKRSRRGSPRFRAALFEAVLPLLQDEEYGPAQHAPPALLALDRKRARGILLGSEVFSPENKRIREVLEALVYEKVPVPGARVRSLLAGIKDGASEYPLDRAYADGLILLARAEGAAAGDVIADARGWGTEKVQEGAAEAAMIAAGVADAFDSITARFEQQGAVALNEPQLYYLTLYWLDAEVRNGGFTQYYFNSSSDLAEHAVEAARVVGARKLADIIAKANRLFGKDGPSPDRDERMDQLSAIELGKLEALDKRYYACDERLSEILPRFVAEHAESFRPEE
jgi:hypothetical protein